MAENHAKEEEEVVKMRELECKREKEPRLFSSEEQSSRRREHLKAFSDARSSHC
jgi:hypothetical protein